MYGGIPENHPHGCIALETGVYEGQDSDSGPIDLLF